MRKGQLIYFFLKCRLFGAIILNGQLDKTLPAHTWRCVSGDMGGKVLLPWSLTCQFTCSLPPTISEASQTQMFYTAYEMFEGHRKRKWAWFPLCWAPLDEASSPSLCHACTHLPQHGHMHTGGLVAPMYNPPKWHLRALALALTQVTARKRLSCRISPQREAIFSYWIRNKDGRVSYSWCLDCTWTLLARTFLFGLIGVRHCEKCIFTLVGNSSWMLSQVSIVSKVQ